MSINERIRYLRKEVLNLSQKQFADKLGMKQTSVSTFEKIDATITDQLSKTICTVFNINELWLTIGEGSMYLKEENFSLDKLVKDHGIGDLELEILKIYFELPKEIRKTTLEHFKNRLTNIDNDSYRKEVKNDNDALCRNLYAEAPKTTEELEALFPPINTTTKDNIG